MSSNTCKKVEELFYTIQKFNDSSVISNKKKAFMRFIDLCKLLLDDLSIAYTLSKVNDNTMHTITFDIEDYLLQITHAHGGYHDHGLKLSLIVKPVDVTKYSLTKSVILYLNGRSHKNLVQNVNRMLSKISDEAKCQLYLNGVPIVYDI